MQTGASTVLVVTANAALGDRLTAGLCAAGYTAAVCASGFAGLSAIAQRAPAVVVVDWTLPLIDGPLIAAAVHAGMDDPPTLIALAPEDAALQARAAGYAAVLDPAAAVPQL